MVGRIEGKMGFQAATVIELKRMRIDKKLGSSV